MDSPTATLPPESLSVCPLDSLADDFRCPNGALVSIGAPLSEVSIHCDAPTSKATRTESEPGPGGAMILTEVEEWTFNEGPHRFVHLLVFRKGVLSEVKTLGYGK
jgi:hypothetical protein